MEKGRGLWSVHTEEVMLQEASCGEGLQPVKCMSCLCRVD